MKKPKEEMSLIARLREPFSSDVLEWRIQSSGISKRGAPWGILVPYVDARAIQYRLDDVFGIEGWQTKFKHGAGGSICELSLKIGGEWVTKSDGAGETDFEGFKGSISKALVRAASSWGIGRYLYNQPTTWAEWVDEGTPGARRDPIKKNREDKNPQYYFWFPPGEAGDPRPDEKPKNSASAAVPKAAPVESQKTVIRTKSKIAAEIMTEAETLGMSNLEINELALEEFKKPTGQLTQPEMEQLLEILQFEVGRRGEKA